ncbi:MAG: dTDP-4-dehydrorhamnose 3,5-epimerase family protein [Actinomycetota bacterium]|nr:dTDP-4-dehydrorhamnose 3,5-epimerase family protein [Actinomycetota bacterium]
MTAPVTDIEGVRIHALHPVHDERGGFVELFRSGWNTEFRPVQWNYLHNTANVMRGFHVHPRHTDLLMLLTGSMRVGLRDLRAASPTLGTVRTIDLQPMTHALLIPAGVGHGFYFPEPSGLCFSVSHEWDPDDDIACRWDDPQLQIEWGCADPVISDRDRLSGSLAEMVDIVRSRGL